MPGTPCLMCSLSFHGFVALGLGSCDFCLAMRMTELTWETLAKKPGGDHDCPYTFGNPRGGLTTLEQGLLLVLRGQVMDLKDPTVAGLVSPAEGDIEPRVETTEAGVLVPVDPEPWIKPFWGDDESPEA